MSLRRQIRKGGAKEQTALIFCCGWNIRVGWVERVKKKRGKLNKIRIQLKEDKLLNAQT